MADAPWLKYQPTGQDQSGPWEKYSSQPKYRPADLSNQPQMIPGPLIPPQGVLREAEPMEKLRLSLPDPAMKALEGLGTIASTAEMLGASPSGVTTELPEAAIGLSMAEPTKLTQTLGGKEIPLTAAEITEKPSWSAAESLLTKFPLSSTMMRDFQDIRNAAIGEYREQLLGKAGPKVEAEELGGATSEKLGSFIEKKSSARQEGLSAIREKTFPGPETSASEAGRKMQEGVGTQREMQHSLASQFYKDAAKDMPQELQLFEARDLRQKARDILKEKGSAPSTLPSGLQSKLEEIVNSPQGLSWDKMHDLQSDYGKISENIRRRGGDPVEQVAYKQLQQSARSDMARRAQQIGGDFLKKYEFAQSFWKDYKTVYDNDVVRKFVKSDPSEIYSTFIKRGSVEDIQKLKNVVGEQGFDPIRRLFVEDIVGSGSDKIPTGEQMARKLAQNKEKLGQILTPQQIRQVQDFAKSGELPKFVETALEKQIATVSRKNPTAVVDSVMKGDPTVSRAVKKIVGPDGWKPYQRNFMEKLIGEAGQDIFTSDKMSKNIEGFRPEFRRLFLSDSDAKQIQDIVKTKRKFESGEKMWGNPSGTARNIIAWEMGKAVFRNPITGTIAVLNPPVLAKFYLSPVGRRLLVDGLNASERTAALTASRISAFTAQAKREYMDEERRKYGLKPVFESE